MQNDSAAKESGSIKICKNGPYLVSWAFPLFSATIECDGSGIPSIWNFGPNLKTSRNFSLCRCGQSSNKPFCDGQHLKSNFDGTETSKNEPFDKIAKIIEGPEIKLKDTEILCASARFCHRGGDIWDNVLISNKAEAKKHAIEDACDCPSGRLVVLDKKTGSIVEPEVSKAIAVIEDPSKGVGGPYWVRGGINVFSADGKLYEIRNRMTLCRCGKSQNKPFCDSSHYPEEDREPK